MLPGWQPCVIVATLHEGRDGPAVDLKVESQIPSKIRRPGNEQMPTGLSGGVSNRYRRNRDENEQESAEVISENRHRLTLAQISSASRLA
jgi:hypothetical protein